MKVGYFVETPVEHNLTGGVRSFLNLAEELLKLGVEPYVVTSEEWAFTDKLKEMGVPYLASKMLRPFVGTTSHVRFEREKYWIKTAINHRTKCRALKWFKENGVELVHINSQFAGVIGSQVAQKMHIPYVYHVREYLEQDFFVQFYSDKLVKNYVANANVVVGISKAIQEHYSNKFDRDVELVYNGIPAGDETICSCEEKLQGDCTHLAIVGRVTGAKGQFEAVKAVDLLVNEYGREDICLHIIGYKGKDRYELDLDAYVKEKNLEKYVILHQFTNTPMEILKNCDVGLMCSVAEAFGRVTVEYMLAGLFVVGANTGGTPEIVLDKETGVLYEQGNERDLAEKIHWVLENKEQAKKMLQSGQERAVKSFSIQATANSIYKIYEKLV